MKEEKKDNLKPSDKSSKIQDKKELTNEELLEQILNKKKTKKSPDKKTESESTSKKSTTKKSTSSKKATQDTKSTSKKKNTKKNNLNSDELLENIITKKQSKKTTSKTLKKTTKKASLSTSTEKDAKKEIKETITDKEIETSPKTEDEIITSEKEQVENIEEKEEKKESTEKKINPEDLIITRRITFDDEKINFKSKKTLEELRKAIEEFDRLETLSEIANSSRKANLFAEDNNETITEKSEEKSDENDLFKTSMIVLDRRSDKYAKIESEEEKENENEEDSEQLDEYMTYEGKEELEAIDEYEDLDDESDDESEITDELDYLRNFDNFTPQSNSSQTNQKKSHMDKQDMNAIILISACILLMLFLILILIFYFGDRGMSQAASLNPEVLDLNKNKKILEKIEENYQNCLSAKVTDDDYTEEINNAIEELNNYIKKHYNASILYENLASGFTYNYNTDKVYYAASTIKALDALYIYTKAFNGEINLDEKVDYESKFYDKSSKGMSQYKFGEKVSLRDLVKYVIVFSDNTAHNMLVNYIGRSNLQQFGNDLGAKNTLNGSDNYGNIDVYDAIIYMKQLNNFFNKDNSLSKELKSYFLLAEQNALEITEENVQAASKYGRYGYNYHEYGIVYAESPYVVAILTNEGKGDFGSKVEDINKHIYELNKLFTENRKSTCETILNN